VKYARPPEPPGLSVPASIRAGVRDGPGDLRRHLVDLRLVVEDAYAAEDGADGGEEVLIQEVQSSSGGE
jgi:hypothetical protein